MRWSTVVDKVTAETVFATFRNSVTKTTTSTAMTFQRGVPVVLCTNTASINGYDIQAAATVTSPVNNLFVGLVDNYPDTTTDQSGTWQGEDLGQVQVYGFNSKAKVYVTSGQTVAVGDLLVPSAATNRGGLVTCRLPVTGAASTDLGVGMSGLCVAVGALASTTTNALLTANVFLRCM